MAETRSILQFSKNIAEQEAPPALPPGEYPAQVVAAEVRENKSGDGDHVYITWEIKPEAYPADFDASFYPEGRRVYQRLGASDIPSQRFRFKRFCEALGVPASTDTFDVGEWIGLSAILGLDVETFEEVETERVKKVMAG